MANFFSVPKYTSVPSQSVSRGYTSYNTASVPVQSNLYRQASIPPTVHIPAPHVGGVSLMSPSMGGQGLYMGMWKSEPAWFQHGEAL